MHRRYTLYAVQDMTVMTRPYQRLDLILPSEFRFCPGSVSYTSWQKGGPRVAIQRRSPGN